MHFLLRLLLVALAGLFILAARRANEYQGPGAPPPTADVDAAGCAGQLRALNATDFTPGPTP